MNDTKQKKATSKPEVYHVWDWETDKLMAFNSVNEALEFLNRKSHTKPTDTKYMQATKLLGVSERLELYYSGAVTVWDWGTEKSKEFKGIDEALEFLRGRK